jgi:hypothetical protein
MDERKFSVDNIPSPYPLPPEVEGNTFQGHKEIRDRRRGDRMQNCFSNALLCNVAISGRYRFPWIGFVMRCNILYYLWLRDLYAQTHRYLSNGF